MNTYKVTYKDEHPITLRQEFIIQATTFDVKLGMVVFYSRGPMLAINVNEIFDIKLVTE